MEEEEEKEAERSVYTQQQQQQQQQSTSVTMPLLTASPCATVRLHLLYSLYFPSPPSYSPLLWLFLLFYFFYPSPLVNSLAAHAQKAPKLQTQRAVCGVCSASSCLLLCPSPFRSCSSFSPSEAQNCLLGGFGLNKGLQPQWQPQQRPVVPWPCPRPAPCWRHIPRT